MLFGEWEAPNFLRWYRRTESKPTNFLKHADQDPEVSLEISQLYEQTDRILLESIAIFGTLGFGLTLEMSAFARWHLSVYPSKSGDELETAVGFVHDLNRNDQLEFGEFLLSIYRDKEAEGRSR